MPKEIEYYIYEVHYSITHTHKEHIEKVKTTTSLYRKDGTEKTRAEVVNDINLYGKVVYSAPPNNGGLKKGAKVITEYLYSTYYIKTIADGTTRDNLDELPTY
jgi:hypothetical protein